jgi:uncharacterized membrane protein YeaQ/YmgE (transglycosylase-associated protein family)
MLDLVVFAVIGLLAGDAVCLWYSGENPMKVLGTVLLAVVGSVCGGLLSWAVWPAVEGQLSFAALLTSFLGAVLVLGMSAVVVYWRSLSGSRVGVPS